MSDFESAAEQAAGDNFDARALLALWNQRMERLRSFAARELAAYALLHEVGQRAGIADSTNVDDDESPRLSHGQLVYQRITLGHEQVELGETYTMERHHFTDAGGAVRMGYRKRSVAPFMRLYEPGAEKPYEIHERTELPGIYELLYDGTDDSHLVGDLLSDRSLPLKSDIVAGDQREDNQRLYLNYLIRAAMDQGMAIPAELQEQ